MKEYSRCLDNKSLMNESHYFIARDGSIFFSDCNFSRLLLPSTFPNRKSRRIFMISCVLVNSCLQNPMLQHSVIMICRNSHRNIKWHHMRIRMIKCWLELFTDFCFESIIHNLSGIKVIICFRTILHPRTFRKSSFWGGLLQLLIRCTWWCF